VLLLCYFGVFFTVIGELKIIKIYIAVNAWFKSSRQSSLY